MQCRVKSRQSNLTTLTRTPSLRRVFWFSPSPMGAEVTARMPGIQLKHCFLFIDDQNGYLP